MSSADIIKGSFGSVRFVSPDLERAYITHALKKSVADGKHTPLMAAALFALSIPMDIVLIGNGNLNTLAFHCLFVKALWILFLILSSVVQDAISDSAKSIALILGWFGSVFVIWYVASLAGDDMAKFYVLQFGLASLSMITLLPVFTHWQIPAMNLFLIVPIGERAWDVLPGQPPSEIWQFLCMAFLMGAVCLFTVVSKRSYEYALREDFARRLDLADARDAALAADHAKSAFLSAVSHDMRTPLNAILGNIQILQKTDMPDQQKTKTLEDAENASRTLLSLVESVLHSASGAPTTGRTQDTSVADVMTEVRSNIQVIAAQKSLAFETRTGGKTGFFRVDKLKLVQVLLNLLTNSTKFTDDGVVGLRLRLLDDRLCFFVYDTGPGMREDDAQKAFYSFFTNSDGSPDLQTGFGLGLAITRDIVDGLGGAIRLRSQLGRATFVSGWIPVEPSEATMPVHVEPIPVPVDACLNVLVIEDEALNIAVLKRLLDSLGQKYTFEQTGQAGIAAFGQTDFDCVFVDIRLPDMTGLDVLTQLSTRSSPHHIPKFAVTANVLVEDLERYTAVGFDGVIAKPIDRDRLMNVLVQVAHERPAIAVAPDKSGRPLVDVEHDPSFRALYAQTARECWEQIGQALRDDDPDLAARMAHRMRGAALFASDDLTVSLAQAGEHAAQAGLSHWRECAEALCLRLDAIVKRA